MAERSAASIEKPSLKERALDELKVYAYITIYFWVIFLMFDLIRATLKWEGMSIVDGGFALVNALVLAKVALVTEAVYKKRKLGDSPVAYRVVLHALVLALILIAFNVVEEGLKALLHGEQVTARFDVQHLVFVLAKSGVFFVMLLPFCAIQELVRELGAGPLTSLFFAPPAGRHYSLVREGTSTAHADITRGER